MDDDLSLLLAPNTFEELIGQKHLFGKGKPLNKYYFSSHFPPSLILFGPPGVGKTSYAKLLSKKHNLEFFHINATNCPTKELRSVLEKGAYNAPILVVIDEIHRLDKIKQDILLPYLEEKTLILIGTSTENPYFKLTKALRSRSFVYEFRPLKENDLKEIALKAFEKIGKTADDNTINSLILHSSNDARKLLNMIDILKNENIETQNIKDFFNIDLGYDNITQRYDLISAFIKSIRGSDVDAALYYLARLISANEDAEFIARRLCILASEDIGLADNNAINIASSTLNIVKEIGMPEARITLAHCCVYLSKTKKSNSAYMAIKKAQKEIESGFLIDVPEHLKSKPTKPYLYPHNYKNSSVKQNYMIKKVKFFEKRNNDEI